MCKISLFDVESTKDEYSAIVNQLRQELEDYGISHSIEAKDAGALIADEIRRFKVFFEEEEPATVVEQQGVESCSDAAWITFIKDNLPTTGAFLCGLEEAYHIDDVKGALCIAHSAAHLISLFCSDWHWTMSYLVSNELRASTKSPDIVDFIGSILPGSFSCKQLENIDDNMIDKYNNTKIDIPVTAFAVGSYDNLGGMHKKNKAARAGASVSPEWNETSTAVSSYCFTDEEMLQYEYSYSPEFDKKWEDLENYEL